jgi:hypothetical protein
LAESAGKDSTLSYEATIEPLLRKIKNLHETAWDGQCDGHAVRIFLEQFENDGDLSRDERVHIAFLLSNFIYFGQREVRELLKALYRDFYKYPVVEDIRLSNGRTRDVGVITEEFERRLRLTRFIGIGNPSESGVHLLYYFRQENGLGKQLFLNAYEIFSYDAADKKMSPRDPDLLHYVFLDDFCGSGDQAISYSNDIVIPLKQLKPNVRVSYYVLFATKHGLSRAQAGCQFDDVSSVVEIDDSFKAFSEQSRIFDNAGGVFNRVFAEAVCRKYGTRLFPAHPLGYKDGQLLLGFSHNTPDNTVPIFWFNETEGPIWHPVFPRYPKQYGLV